MLTSSFKAHRRIAAGPARSPIDRLPNELLTALLALTLPDDLEEGDALDEDDPETTYSGQLFALQSVCKCWHRAILGTPSFWALISLRSPIQWIHRALDLSRDIPIRVICVVPQNGQEMLYWDEMDDSDDFPLDHFLSAITPHVARWQSAVFQLPIMKFDTIVNTLEEAAPLLEAVTLSFFGVSGVENAPRCIQLFGGSAKRLHTITLDGVCADWSSPVFSDLRDLHLLDIDEGAPSLGQILSILQRSPSIMVIEIGGVSVVDGDAVGDEYIEDLVCLQELNISHLDEHAVSGILSHLKRLPTCRILHVGCRITHGTIKDFLVQHMSHLLDDLKRILSTPPDPSEKLHLSLGIGPGQFAISEPNNGSLWMDLRDSVSSEPLEAMRWFLGIPSSPLAFTYGCTFRLPPHASLWDTIAPLDVIKFEVGDMNEARRPQNSTATWQGPYEEMLHHIQSGGSDCVQGTLWPNLSELALSFPELPTQELVTLVRERAGTLQKLRLAYYRCNQALLDEIVKILGKDRVASYPGIERRLVWIGR